MRRRQCGGYFVPLDRKAQPFQQPGRQLRVCGTIARRIIRALANQCGEKCFTRLCLRA
jgi:hypothetical protein